MSPEFVVNPEKRAVVALLYRTNGGALVGKGIAKCMPGDVFNEHIGKAIALGRTLGLDVSEFEGAVQPTFAEGQLVMLAAFQNNLYKVTAHKKDDKWYLSNTTQDEQGWDCEENLIIINDTNAIYGGVE